MGFVAKKWNGEIAGWHGSIILPFCFRELQCPARMTILVRQLSGFVLPVFRNTSFPKVVFLCVGVLLWSSHQVASRIWPDIGR